MEQDNKSNKDFKLKRAEVRVLENGYVLRVEKSMTDDARKKLRKASKKGEPEIDYSAMHKSEEYAAGTLKELLKRMKEELSEYDNETEFDKAFESGEE